MVKKTNIFLPTEEAIHTGGFDLDSPYGVSEPTPTSQKCGVTFMESQIEIRV